MAVGDGAFVMPHPSLGHCSFLPKCCLNLLKAIRFKALADVQTMHRHQEQVMVQADLFDSYLDAKTERLRLCQKEVSCSHG